MTKKIKKAWGGRFQKESHPLLEKFNASISFDQTLYNEDIDGSIAHATMLASCNILSKAEARQIIKGLNEVREEIANGTYQFNDKLEDIHMAVETRLTQKIGPLGGKLHTARSRNDQVALDIRLYCRKQIIAIDKLLHLLQETLIDLAQKKGFCILPGYTHLQRAQPILLAHHLLAYFEMILRDRDRLQDCLKRLNYSPLGSGALAGTTFPIDRNEVAQLLSFYGPTHNSLDSVSDRDFVAELLFDLSLLSIHLSRFAEELILWVSQEFSFITLPQEFCTGSSMMPQKVNPDIPELVRGKSGRLIGNLTSLLVVLKGLPLAYNKDMQEDKEPLFDSIETIVMTLQVFTAMIAGLDVRADKMLAATEEGFLLATDLADYLAARGIPFREAHEIVGVAIRYCLQHKKTLEKLSLDELRRFSQVIENDVFEWLHLENSVNRRKSVGGTAKKNVLNELKLAKKRLQLCDKNRTKITTAG